MARKSKFQGGICKKLISKNIIVKKYGIKTFGLVVPLLNGTIDFIGEDGKHYNTDKKDLILIEEE